MLRYLLNKKDNFLLFVFFHIFSLPKFNNMQITSQYGRIIIEVLPPISTNQPTNRIQTDYIELDLSNVFTDCIKNVQNSQKAISNFKKDVFSIFHSYFSKIDTIETFYVSLPQTSRPSIIKNEIDLFHNF